MSAPKAKTPKTGIAQGFNKGHVTTLRTAAPKISTRKGVCVAAVASARLT